MSSSSQEMEIESNDSKNIFSVKSHSKSLSSEEKRYLKTRLVELSSSETEKESNISKTNRKRSQSRSVSGERRSLKKRLIKLSDTEVIFSDIRKKDVPENQKCKFCGKLFSMWSKLMDHVHSVHNTEKLCYQCGTYIHKDIIKKHMQEVHEVQQKVITRFFFISKIFISNPCSIL